MRMGRLVMAGATLLAIFSLLMGCGRKYPIGELTRTDFSNITLNDCAGKQYTLADEKLQDQLWLAVSSAQHADIPSLRQNTGFVRVQLDPNGREEVLYLEVVATLDNGPVIVSYGDRLTCAACDSFFVDVKDLYPDFNWCRAPKIN